MQTIELGSCAFEAKRNNDELPAGYTVEYVWKLPSKISGNEKVRVVAAVWKECSPLLHRHAHSRAGTFA